MRYEEGRMGEPSTGARELSEAEAVEFLREALSCLLELVRARSRIRYTRLLDMAIDHMLEKTSFPKEYIKAAVAFALLQLIADGYVILQDRYVSLPDPTGAPRDAQ